MVTTAEGLLSKSRDNSSFQTSSHLYTIAVRSGYSQGEGLYNTYQLEVKEYGFKIAVEEPGYLGLRSHITYSFAEF